MSGLLTAIRLEEAGLPYTVIEKNPAVGGTWLENSYPGCRVDVGNHFYCYSFEPNPDWSEFFAQRGELQAYFERCMEKYGVRDRIRFETEVIAASYDEGAQRWSVRLRAKGGCEEGVDSLAQSAIIAPSGQIVAECHTLGDELIVADCDLDDCDFGKRTIFNFAAHRRTEAYGLITERTGAEPPPE